VPLAAWEGNPLDQNLLTVALERARAFADQDHASWIDGRAQSSGGDCTDLIDPSSEGVIGRSAGADGSQIHAAVEAARRSFESRAWRGLRPADRERILLRWADLIGAHADELAALETLNQGKSVHVSRMVDVAFGVEFTRYMAGWATKISGETVDVSIGFPPGVKYSAFTRREPVGVVAGIAPWNFPMLIGLWKIVPALAAGCSVILKPAEITPLTSLKVARLAQEAGVPDGVLNILLGSGRVVGSALARHPGIAKISITGSTQAGKDVGRNAIENMTRVTLELGGKNPAIFLPDVAIDKVLPGILAGAFLNQGQVCAAASRIFVPRNQQSAYTDAISSAVSNMKVGSGSQLDTEVTPLASRSHRETVARYVDIARAEGGVISAGGAAPDRAGYFYLPTVVANATNQMRHVREEIFGPVVSIIPYDSAEQAVAMANDTPYGLAASLWSNDLSAVMRLIPTIDAGTVWVNTHNLLDPQLPFGGFKQSGWGREFGRGAVESHTELKSVLIAH